MNNPYSPPSSRIAGAPLAVVAKPFLVMAVQFYGCVYMLIGACTVVLAAAAVFTRPRVKLDADLFVVALGASTVAVALLAAMLQGIRRRTDAGRILGMAFIVFVTIPSVLLPAIKFGALADSTGGRLALLLLALPHFYWAYAFGLSPSAQRYFGDHPAAA